jgi:TonB family protein
MLDTKRDRKAPRRAVTAAVSVMALCLVAPIAAVQAKSDPSEVMTAQQAGGSPATGWLKEGDVALEHAQYPQAKAAYTMALNAGGSGAEAATALIHLGMIEVAMKDFGGALSDFERAEAANSGKAGEARMWMAITQERQANLDAADGLYQSALAAEEPNSSLAATIMERYAQLLQQQGRHDEANTMRVQAAGIRKTQAELELASSEPPTPDVYRVGGGVTAPMLVSKAEPAYTQQARIAKYQGTALLSVEIGEDGVARNIKVARGLGFGLDQKAVEAVKQWRFKPGVKGGEPVKVAAQIEINFALI